MNPKTPTVSDLSQAVNTYVVAGSLPVWEQMSQPCQQELILALAALLLHLPEIQPLLGQEGQHEPE